MRTRNGIRVGVLGLFIVAAMLIPGVALAADFKVTTTADGDDKECEQDCTLREAVVLAGPNDRVQLPSGTYRLTMGELALAGDEIVGEGARSTVIDAGGSSRVMRVEGTDLTSDVSAVTIARGNGESSVSSGAGGGIFVLSGSALTLVNSTVRNNTGEQGGGIAAAGTLQIVGSTISGNTASFSRQTRGGGIYSTSFLLLGNSTVSGNEASDANGTSQGGGVASIGRLAISYSTIADNKASAGGLFVTAPQEGLFTMVNSLLDGGTGGACAGTGLGTLTATNDVADDGSCQLKDPSNRQDVNTALGALADNGGPTNTHALLPTSAAINAAGTCVSTDQRGVTRPQTGSTCDSGAYEYRAPTLKVTTTVTNNDGGTRAPADFTVHVRQGGTDVKGSPQDGSAAGSTYVLDAGGAYVVAADALAGYTITVGGDCTQAGTITLAEGDNRTCTITATDNPPTLRVITGVTNNNGGTLTPAGVSVHVRRNGVELAGSPAAGVAGPIGRLYTTQTGPHTVLADAMTGYTISYSAGCTVTIGFAENVTCTVTLDDIAPTLRVITAVNNNAGGTLAPADFMAHVKTGATDVPGSPQPGIGAPGRAYTLTAGVVYTVSADPKPGYGLGVAGTCAADGTITLTPGQNATCTITATDTPPRLRVITAVTNDDGGTLAPGNFQAHVRIGATDVNGSPQAGTSTGTLWSLAAGVTYTVAVTPVSGYSFIVSGDCAPDGTITMPPDVDRTCTITADDDDPPPPPVSVQASAQLPPPEAGKTVNAEPKSGTVKVKPPGAKAYVALDEAQQLPVGTIVDARNGHVTLIAAADASGGTATAEFWAGIFRLGQTKGATPITTLTLVEKLSCPKRGRASTAAKRKKKRRLWGDGKGKFRTDGQYSSATVRGTKWLVEDRCTSTLTRVVRGRVAVRDKVKRKTVIVRAGKKYVAKARKS